MTFIELNLNKLLEMEIKYNDTSKEFMQIL